MAMGSRGLHMILFLAVLLVAVASVATARQVASDDEALVGETEVQTAGSSFADESKKQQVKQGTHYSELSDEESKSVEDDSDDETTGDVDDDGSFNDEDKKSNHHSKPPKKTNHHPKPPKKTHHHKKSDDTNDAADDANP